MEEVNLFMMGRTDLQIEQSRHRLEILTSRLEDQAFYIQTKTLPIVNFDPEYASSR
ncbi:MAG TPA: hypothetical protein VF469_07585 [Kofleriaceae bacterium]